MSILDSELLMFKSLVVSDAIGNGGKLDNSEQVTTGVVNNVWPSVFKAERLAGSTKFRKTFLKVQNDDNLTLYYPQLWLDIITPGDDHVTFFPATQIDTQTGANPGGGFDGSELHYGCGTLDADITGGNVTSTFDVDVEHLNLVTGAVDEIFRDGDTIRITDKIDPTSGSGNEEIHTISGTPTNTDTVVTITITGTVANAFTTLANTRVMTVYEPSDTVSSWDNWAETCKGTGTYDEGTTGNVVADNIGSIEETYTLTFTDTTHFTVTNVAMETVGTGDTGTNFIPLNDDNSKPLLTILAAGWAGVWDETGTADNIVFKTHPATIPIWQKRTVPAGAGSLAGNRTVVAVTGESV